MGNSNAIQIANILHGPHWCLLFHVLVAYVERRFWMYVQDIFWLSVKIFHFTSSLLGIESSFVQVMQLADRLVCEGLKQKCAVNSPPAFFPHKKEVPGIQGGFILVWKISITNTFLKLQDVLWYKILKQHWIDVKNWFAHSQIISYDS